jgi:hypothetical protein
VFNEYLFQVLSERVARLYIRDNKSSKNDIHSVVAYAPTESSGDILELDWFYCDLDHALRVESMFFRHRLRQRTSWIHPAIGFRKLLDLLRARGFTFRDVGSYTNYYCDSDHDLVIVLFISELVHERSDTCE